MAEVLLNLGVNSYTIHIKSGSIGLTGDLIKNFLPDKSFTKKAMIVTDDNVKPLYGETLLNNLKLAGYEAGLFSVRPGETSKSPEILEQLYTQAITRNLDRKSPVIALGGGVIGDLAGFMAATYLRGVPFIQIPTTLLAQVDSSVGGKTAINHTLGKNLIGAFYQPSLVIIDPEVLKSLPEREFKAGLAEVIKYGAFADREFFSCLKTNAENILSKDSKALTEIISRSCRIKRDIVEKDEREENLRMFLNFGHTIGHAIEAVGNFSKYNHGEAVALGMRGAAIISNLAGLCDKSVVSELEGLIEKFGLPLKAPECASLEKLQSYLSRDKKSIGGEINWVLLTNIGSGKITAGISDDIVKEAVLALIK